MNLFRIICQLELNLSQLNSTDIFDYTVSADQWRRQDFVSGAQVWRREKTENNKCISYHPRQQPILTNMRHCIRPVCHSHSVGLQ